MKTTKIPTTGKIPFREKREVPTPACSTPDFVVRFPRSIVGKLPKKDQDSPLEPKIRKRDSERGATMMAVLGMMTILAIGLMAVAPSIQHEVQREKEVEAIRRGEEVADAIRQYVQFYNGQRLPESIDDLLEGLPQGTKKRQILRASAAVDPLSEDGKWRLVKPDPETIARFAQRVQEHNNGVLPSNPSPVFNRYTVVIVNSLNTGIEDVEDEDFEVVTDNQPFIGVASQSRGNSIINYYSIERHSNWIFTPLFRGNSSFGGGPGVPITPVRPPVRPLN
jgi:type II secretory pathway pseudopilin PulG